MGMCVSRSKVKLNLKFRKFKISSVYILSDHIYICVKSGRLLDTEEHHEFVYTSIPRGGT
jgi:hypothetical protein